MHIKILPYLTLLKTSSINDVTQIGQILIPFSRFDTKASVMLCVTIY